MTRSRIALAVALTLALAAQPSIAVRSAFPRPAGDVSENVRYVTTLPEAYTAIAINFIGTVMFVSTTTGIFSYDVRDPASPRRLGTLPMYIWENEDVDVDAKRKRLFVSRDPRGFTTTATSGSTFPYGAVHIVDVSEPRAMRVVGTFLVPAGHTTTCVNACDHVWTGGPGANAISQPEGWAGRPIYATDVRDPLNPISCPDPIDLERNDGVTDYAHDVQVDAAGVAWVSGRGGVRGYWTSGKHRDPTTGRTRTATACKPIPYAGGGTPSSATPSRFMHNAWRNAKARIPGVSGTTGMVLYGTEENVTSNCESAGRFATYDLRSSLSGKGWTSKTFRMTVLDTWTPDRQPGSTACASAHYFRDRGDGILAAAFYGQGVRFLDVTDPRRIRQVGFWRPNGGRAWAAYWRGSHVFVADYSRGVDVIRFTGGSSSKSVPAPAPSLPIPPIPMDPAFGYLCALPRE